MAVDMFLKIEGIEGESQDAKHKNEIEIHSFSWGATQTGTFAQGGGGGAGKVAMHDFTFEMKTCKSSPKLLLACAKGDHIPKAELTCRKAGGEQQEYLKVTFSDLLVSNFQHSGTQGDEPTERISLNFAQIQEEYREQDNRGQLLGPIKTGYNLKKMQAV